MRTKTTPPIQEYPELQALVTPLVRQVVQGINQTAPNVPSAMPYKAQYVLEQVIRALQELV